MASCDVPADVVFQFLLLLPVKSLLRFKSVCKFWCDLIQSSTFITQHHLHHKDSGNSNLVAKNYGDNFKCQFILFSGDNFEVSCNMDSFKQWYPVSEIKLVGSCDGIVCLQHHLINYSNNGTGSLGLALWNPATQEFRRLPECPFYHELQRYSYGCRYSYAQFGFDVNTKDYKVVMITMKFFPGFAKKDEARLISDVDVYSLSTDSWRFVHRDIVLPVELMDDYPQSVSRNGIFSWLGLGISAGHETHDLLLSFDISNGVFETTPLPDEFISSDHYICSLDFMDDNFVCIVGNRNSDPSNKYAIWILGEYGVKESWTKLCIIGPFERSRPCNLSKNGRFIFVTERLPNLKKQLVLYDKATKETKNLNVHDNWKIQFFEYNESLVSIKRVNGAA